MTREQIQRQITLNLTEAGLMEPDVRVRQDGGDEWQIVVICKYFEGMSPRERRNLASKGLEGITLGWFDLLTPRESEWAGPLPNTTEASALPLWPESLARGARLEIEAPHVLFPSDLDEDIKLPVTVTFYSLRGGVGRSSALAYTGRILAARGRKVICVDMDLEAPGLVSLFGAEKDMTPGMGLVHLLAAFDRGEEPDIVAHLLRVSDSDDLYCLPAGFPDTNYARLLSVIDPSSWYREERNPLHLLLEGLKTKLPFTPDVILLDSRTGITSLSAPLLFDLADIAIVVFFPHPQTYTGTTALVRALLAAHTQRKNDKGEFMTPEPRFLVSPIPPSKAPEIANRYEHRPLEWVSDWLSVLNGLEPGNEINETDITHFIPYREVIATSDWILTDRDVWRLYEPVAGWIERFLPLAEEEDISANVRSLKDSVLDQLRFSAGTAEHQENFFESFVETDIVRRAIQPGIPLVLGRKGTGKTAVFRYLAEESTRCGMVITSPAPLRGDRHWILGPEGYEAVSSLLSDTNLGWRTFWKISICLAFYFSSRGKLPAPDQLLTPDESSPQSEYEMIKTLRKLCESKDIGLIADDWLGRLDQSIPNDTLLLFDGLDTGFGNRDKDRERRRAALEGLLSLLIERSDIFRHLYFKIMLREDIWRQLKFENKSHLFGRTVSLKWNDITSFIKVCLKQAIQSPSFSQLVKKNRIIRGIYVDDWQDHEVFAAWNFLVGERIKGGKTAVTRNWVWNRLSDGNEDHSPRYLLQLMHQVSQWERKEQRRSPYERSVIRPRGLLEVFSDVSEQALSALRDEEYPELQPLMSNLTEIGRTPLEAESLKVPPDLINLAREVGMLGVYEGTEEKIERYKVPDLFRYALKMTRKGQQ